VPLREASMKVRADGPVDDPADLDPAVWAGVIPVRRVAEEPRASPDTAAAVPGDIRRRAQDLGR